jgi:lysozyme
MFNAEEFWSNIACPLGRRCTMTLKDILKARLPKEEGSSLFPYQDSKLVWSIGIGHNMEVDPSFADAVADLKANGKSVVMNYTITPEREDELLETDIEKAQADLLRVFPWTAQLDIPRLSVFIDLTFNMGVGNPQVPTHGLVTMVNTMRHASIGDWPDVANRLRQSEWYQDVKAIRAEPLINILLTGVIPQ